MALTVETDGQFVPVLSNILCLKPGKMLHVAFDYDLLEPFRTMAAKRVCAPFLLSHPAWTDK
jgi:hypothetical protein